MKANTTLFGFIGLVLVALVLTGCIQQQDNRIPSGDPLPGSSFTGSDTKEGTATQERIEFDSIEDVRAFLERAEGGGSSARSFGTKSVSAELIQTTAVSVDGGMSEGAVPASDSSYSQTNVQYEAVDEADFVKTDGEYIYLIPQRQTDQVMIFNKDNEQLSMIRLSSADKQGYKAKELFVFRDTLIVLAEYYQPAFYFERYDITPRQSSRTYTEIQTFDISDRSNPTLREQSTVTGRYYQSRLIGSKLYLVAQEYARVGTYVPEPIITRSSGEKITPAIVGFDNPDSNYHFNTVVSLDITTDEIIDSTTLLLGYANTLMVSEDNIYIAYHKQNYWWWYHRPTYSQDRFYDVILPLLEGDIKVDINAVLAKSYDKDKEWYEISRVLGLFYKELEKNASLQKQYRPMFETIEETVNKYDAQKLLEDEHTVIHKIGIDDGMFTYLTKAEVSGRLLNQFSLDETDGYLRVATTVNLWLQNGRVQYSNVYVLDEDLHHVGEITELAPDERIYSARFMHDRLYLVTYRQVDPFFVIDLSDPKEPQVLGELKIPGWSSYLHPYDENHIIGVGKDASEDGRTVGGVKLALFDVEDPNNPTLVDEVTIGKSGSDTPILRDHKAFLFDKERGMLVLPVREVISREEVSPYRLDYSVSDAAYVYQVTEDGFTEKGFVEHAYSSTQYFRFWYEATVKRSLYIGDVLYTVSDKYLKANDLSEEGIPDISTVELPETVDTKIPEPVPFVVVR